MLQVKHICKKYVTGKLEQQALDDVSLNLRDNEFVAILGPSGSGKTTLLNMIGGLDRYDSGELIINGISTKKYSDRDWDSYRNHTIGFVFQSYNLIPHQSVLSNVELALTIGGISSSERKKRAKRALKQVGLEEHMHKRPNQLSGGQMQRVAIARALVNDPDIVLADEPTGALDSDTSVQVMDLLKDVAKDRLVVMVTHNPDLAEEYATRIVRLKDGRIVGDSDPYQPDASEATEGIHKRMGRSSMSLPTSIGLSLNNLWTKKARTILTAFAGSIGIIGIALILSLSTGVNDYIEEMEEETLADYPVQITNSGFDITSMMSTAEIGMGNITGQIEDNGEVNVVQILSTMFSSVDTNDLKSLRAYLESGETKVKDYANSIEYSFNVEPQVYRLEDDGDYRQVNPDSTFSSIGLGTLMSSDTPMASMMSMVGQFSQMPDNEDLYINQYDVVAGHWPENYNECILVLTEGGSINDLLGYALGLRDSAELDDLMQSFLEGESVEDTPEFRSFTYEEIMDIDLKLVNSYEYYEYDEDNDLWVDRSNNTKYMKELVKNGEDLKIVGIVKPAEDASSAMLSMGLNYPSSLIEHVIDEAKRSDIVQDQLANRDINVFTGEPFGEDSDNELDMASLFDIDSDAMSDLFGLGGMDLSSMMGSMGGMDLSSAFDLSSGTFDLSSMMDMSSMDLSGMSIDPQALASGIQIKVTYSDMENMVNSLAQSYDQYIQNHKNVTSIYDLQEDYNTYLMAEDGGMVVIQEFLADVLSDSDNSNLTVTIESIQNLIYSLIGEYLDAYNNGTASDFESWLEAGNGQDTITAWIGDGFEIDPGSITITQDQMEQLSNNLSDGYEQYAKDNKLTTSDDVTQGFAKYLESSSGQQAMTMALSSMISTEGLSAQINAVLQQSMASAYASMGNSMNSMVSSMTSQMMSQLSSGMTSAMTDAFSQIGNNFSDMMNLDADAFTDAFDVDIDPDDLSDLLTSALSGGDTTYDDNLATLGYADLTAPYSIDIYPKDFESKGYITDILDDYNDQMEASGNDDRIITYTDIVGTLMSSVTEIINLISYVLIAFVAISLIVSSIMIGVITYISVLERQKEIGILRAMGASKRNISNVFNAEAGIIGLFAGLLGVGASMLILIPANAIIHRLSGSESLTAVLPTGPAIALIILSIVLTLIGGLIPSRKAAHSDPVTALRTE